MGGTETRALTRHQARPVESQAAADFTLTGTVSITAP
jgi:hypothetical protein